MTRDPSKDACGDRARPQPRARAPSPTRLVWLLLAWAGLSCEDPSARNEPEAGPVLNALAIGATEALTWPYRHELAADLDGDGADETVVAASDVTLSDAGAVLWEDGHRWVVVVKDGAAASVVFSAFVPRGFVEVAILRPAEEHDRRQRLPGQRGRPPLLRRARDVLVLERSPEQLRVLTIGYEAPERIRSASVAYYQLESWIPGSATLPDR